MKRLLNKFQLSRYRRKTEHHAALDIGTEYVKVVLFKIGPDRKARVVGTGKSRQGLSDMTAGVVSDIAGVVENAQRALREAEKMASVAADDAIVGIAGELVKGAALRVNHLRPNPNAEITADEVDRIVDAVQKESLERIRRELRRETGLEEVETRLVNASIVDVKIDGQKVSNPLGFRGREVSVAVFNAFAPLVALGALETVVGELGLDLITIAAEPYAVARSIGTTEADFSAIFVDIGGGTTDVAVVSNGGVEGTVSYAIGGRSFTKRLSAQLDAGFEAAERTKLAYAGGELPPSESAPISALFQKDVAVWLAGLSMALAEFSHLELLPSRILLCGGGSKLPEIREALQSDFYEDLPFSRKPTVRFVEPKEVETVVDQTGTLDDQQQITAMGLANLVLSMEIDDSVLGRALRNVVKTLET